MSIKEDKKSIFILQQSDRVSRTSNILSSKMHFKFLYQKIYFFRFKPSLAAYAIFSPIFQVGKKKKNQGSLKKKEEKDHYRLASLSK